MKANKGFTLIEIAVVLAIIAVLAAILTPLVTSYIDQARTTRAVRDTKQIAQSFILFKRDTSVWPNYASFLAAKTNTTPEKDCLVSGTNNSTTVVPTGWSCTTVGLLTSYLNVSTMADLPINSAESLTRGNSPNFRGPYLDGLNGNDPWGAPYVVNAGELKGSSTAWAMAMSAGPDGSLTTSKTLSTASDFSTGGDDIGFPIRGNRN